MGQSIGPILIAACAQVGPARNRELGRVGARPKPYRSAVQHRAPAIVGAILGVATAAVYLIGANRSYGYDAAATFANFVATPSLWDAFAIHSVLPTVPIKSVASNDHVASSSPAATPWSWSAGTLTWRYATWPLASSRAQQR